jgi:hypothetical protein
MGGMLELVVQLIGTVNDAINDLALGSSRGEPTQRGCGMFGDRQ